MDNEEFDIEEETNDSGGSDKTGMDRVMELINENKKLIIIVGVVILLLIIMSAVTKSGDSKNIKLSEESKTITTASGVQLQLLVDGNETNTGVTWSSSDERVAVVDQKGAVRGISEGSATITATYENEKYTCEITVSKGEAGVAIESVTFNEGTLVMSVGSTYTPVVEIVPGDAQVRNKIYSSSDRNVATVDITSGEVTANALGTATIRVAVNDAEKMGALKVWVINDEITPGLYKLPTSIKLTENEITLTEGERKTLSFTQEPEGSTIDYVKWISNDPTTAVVENNELVALKPGDTDIVISSFGMRDTLKVHVKSASIEVSTIELTSEMTISMNVGDSRQVTAKILPENATNKEILFESSSPAIAVVDSVGNVTGVSAGTATITVKSASKPNLYATVTVNVQGSTVPVTPDPPSGGGDPSGGGYSSNVGTVKLTSNNNAVESSVSALSGKTMTSTTLTITTSGNVDKVLYCKYEYSKENDCTTYAVYNGPFVFKTPGTFVFKLIPYYNNNAGSTLTRYVKISGNGTGTGKCEAGRYLSGSSCLPCRSGNYCIDDKKYVCPAGTGSSDFATASTDCKPCPKDSYSTGDGNGCRACPSGTSTNNVTGATSVSKCTATTTLFITCRAGQYYNGSGSCKTCPANSYCPGISINTGDKNKVLGNVPCPNGTTSPEGSSNVNQCVSSTLQKTCSAGRYYDGRGNCQVCPAGYYCEGCRFPDGDTQVHGKTACPSGTTSPEGATSASQCTAQSTLVPPRIQSYSTGATTYDYTSGWGYYPFIPLNNVKADKNFNMILLCYYVINSGQELDSSKCVESGYAHVNKLEVGTKGGRTWIKIPRTANKWYLQELSSEYNNANFYIESEEMNRWGQGTSSSLVLHWSIGIKTADGRKVSNQIKIIRINSFFGGAFKWPIEIIK